jgi:teichuronic acid biosynthesis glycosyltransferase TuaC
LSILIFAEEYTKLTKGTYNIWQYYVQETSKRFKVHILLNNEHWATDEAVSQFQGNVNVSVHQLPFKMPSTYVNYIFNSLNHIKLFRAVKYIFGQFVNLIVSPVIIFYLAKWLNNKKSSIIFSHSGGWPAGSLCRLIILSAFLTRIPKRILIIHSHPSKHKELFRRLLSTPIRLIQAGVVDIFATTIVAVSDSVKSSLESIFFLSPVVRIHNGISLSSQSSKSLSTLQKLNWYPVGTVVGFIGALYHYKGAHVLLDAFRQIDIPSELALLGPAEPAYLEILQQKALLCKNNVSFLGFSSDVDDFIEKIDVLVVPSITFESFGIVILEAMRLKKPVICSSFGGMKEVVEDGVTGLVVPSGDSELLAEAIKTLLIDEDLRFKMGEAGYLRLNKLFTSEKMAAQYDALFTRKHTNIFS